MVVMLWPARGDLSWRTVPVRGARADPGRDFYGLGLRTLVGLLRESDFVSLTGISRAEISSPHARLQVATDGETSAADTPLRYRIRPGDLLLLAP